MNIVRKSYPEDHWLKSPDPEEAIKAYLEQQSKAYSRVKNAFIRQLAGDLRGKRVLDYGCGGGFFTVQAALAGASQVVAVDAEESVLGTARYFARIQGVEHLCRFVCRDSFPEWPEKKRFDLILLKDVIEHVPDDQGLLTAAAGALAPGGKLVLSTQNSLSLNYLIQGSYHRIWLEDKDWFGWDPTHLRFYTPMSMARKVREAGLRPVSWRSIYLIPYKLPGLPGSRRQFLRLDALSWIDRALGQFFPYNRLGWNIILLAQASPLVTRPFLLAEPIEASPSPLPVLVTRQSLG
jgi:2-polyprenyl-6-hydroxyphenyl methylase / 3-demethylubiquinone-9 3-methyltransferase